MLPPSAEFRPVCTRCRRPTKVCWCQRIRPVHSRTRACFLQHPRESRVAIGTARMAHLSLSNSELHLGVEFQQNPRVSELAGMPGTAVLFPGPGSVDPSTLVGAPPSTLIVIDGTWAQARKVIKRNPALQALPRIGLRPPRPSNYRIRKEPSEECVSTIEAVVHVLSALEGDAGRFEPLLEVFDGMIDAQLEWQARRPGPPRVRRKKPNRVRLDPALDELRSRPNDVVALYAESNAHPMGSEVPGDAELLQLVAVRPATGERFDALLRPRRPLAPSAALHLEIAEALILGGETADSALARFRAFLRPDDLLCGWGHYAKDLLRREGEPERPFTDLRLAAARRLRRRPGGVEQAVRLLGQAELPEPMGPGRAGRRLAGLAALFALLCENATEAGATPPV